MRDLYFINFLAYRFEIYVKTIQLEYVLNKNDINHINNGKFDLVVIGTGAAASTVAYKCALQGWKVAIIDSRPFGGTCALRGCDPKKVLVAAEEAIDWNTRMKGKGISHDANTSTHINWPELMS